MRQLKNKITKMGHPTCVVVVVAVIATLQVVSAAAAREFLEAHNEARAAVGVSPKLGNATSLVVRYQRNKMDGDAADGGGGMGEGEELLQPHRQHVRAGSHTGGVEEVLGIGVRSSFVCQTRG